MQWVRAQSPEWADEIKIRALTLIDNGVENEKLMTSWERRESARTGKPIDQVLHELIEASGGKWEVIGAITGMTRPSAAACSAAMASLSNRRATSTTRGKRLTVAALPGSRAEVFA